MAGGSGSASTPAARSPTSSRSTRSTGAGGHDQDARPRRPTRPTASWPASRKVLDADGRGTAPTWPRSATAPRWPPTSCSRARSASSGFITTEGYEFLLEIARQSVPDGYGNSYFWVKPPRIVPAAPGAHRRRPAGLPGRARCARSTRRARVEVARWFRDAGIDTIGVCFLHSYADPAHELAMREVLRREHPAAVVSHLQRGAARVPGVRARRHHAGRRGGEAADGVVRREHPPAVCDELSPARRAVLRHEVQRRRAVGRGGRAPADHHRPVRAGGRRAGRGPGRPRGRLRPAAHLRRRRHLDRRRAWSSTASRADHRGHRRQLPEQGPDDRRRHRRRGRRVGGLGVARRGAQGRARARPAPTRGRSATAAAAPSRPSPTRTCVLGRIPPHLLGGEIPLDVAGGARPGSQALADRLGLELEQGGGRHPGDLGLEPGQRAARGHRQAWTRRARLHDGDLRRVRLAAAVPADRRARARRRAGAARPGQPVRVRAAHRRRAQRLRAYARSAGTPTWTVDGGAACSPTCRGQAAAALDREGFAPDRAPLPAQRRPALLRARRSRCGSRRRTVAVDDGFATAVADAFHDAHEQLYGYAFRGDARQPVEWVNLRVTGIGPIERPQLPSSPPARRRHRAGAHRRTSGVLRRLGRTRPSTGGPTWRPATWSPGRP